MGERGQVKKYGDPIAVKFPKGVEAQLKIFAQMDGVSVSALIRKLVTEGLQRRIPSKSPLGKEVQNLLKVAENIERLSQSQKPSAVRKREKTFVNTKLSPRSQAVVDEYHRDIWNEMDDEMKEALKHATQASE